MKTKIVKIGNSRGIRIPKALIEAAGLDTEVELSVVPTGILIEKFPRRHPREGWAEAARLAHERGDDVLVYEYFNNDFDETEWVWE